MKPLVPVAAAGGSSAIVADLSTWTVATAKGLINAVSSTGLTVNKAGLSLDPADAERLESGVTLQAGTCYIITGKRSGVANGEKVQLLVGAYDSVGGNLLASGISAQGTGVANPTYYLDGARTSVGLGVTEDSWTISLYVDSAGETVRRAHTNFFEADGTFALTADIGTAITISNSMELCAWVSINDNTTGTATPITYEITYHALALL